MIGEFDGMIAGDDHLTGRVLESAERMRIISKWGIGTDEIDLGAATRLGIEVTNTPAVFGDDVADVAAGYLVMLARQLHVIDRSVRDGRMAQAPRRGPVGQDARDLWPWEHRAGRSSTWPWVRHEGDRVRRRPGIGGPGRRAGRRAAG